MIINKPVVIFDIETTGLDIINDQIIDISLIKLDLDSSEKIKQYKRLFEFENVELEFNDDAIKEIAKKAISKKTGARGLRSILENILLKTMYDLPSQEDIDEVIVDASAAKGQSQPILVHSKGDSKSKSNKTTAA